MLMMNGSLVVPNLITDVKIFHVLRLENLKFIKCNNNCITLSI